MRSVLNIPFLVLLLFATPAFAQPYGNEWILFSQGQPLSSQQYFRMSVWKEGIYRLSYADLQSAGVPVTSWFSTDRYQVFHRGVEQYIQVVDQNNDNIFGPGDFLEFYGRANDGLLDTPLYDSAYFQPNPYVSLFNDTASYFLTYNPFSIINRRMSVVSDNNYSAYVPAPFFTAESVRAFGSEYNIGPRDYNDIADNSYMEGEGFVSSRISKSAPFDVNFDVRKYLPVGNPPAIETVVIGANALAHPYRFLSGNQVLLDTIFAGYELARHRFSITNLPTNGIHVFRFSPLNDPTFSGNLNYMQMAYARLTYNRSFDFTGENLPQSMWMSGSGKTLVELTGLTTGLPRLYHFSGDTIRRVLVGTSGSSSLAIVPLGSVQNRLYLTTESLVYSASGNIQIAPVNPDPDPSRFARFTNFSTANVQDGIVMISQTALWQGASAYADYRRQRGAAVLLADVEELYDQFAFGVRKHTLGIRRFADFLLDQVSPKPKHLLFIGKSVLGENARSGTGYALNLVPTFGEPASDVMFTSRLNTTEFKPELATGRISALNNADILSYLDKVTAFENQQSSAPTEWMKNILHFGGGTDIGEQNFLASKLAVYKEIVEDTLFGGKVTTILKSSTDPIQINLSQFVQQLIDSGCSMMTFYGHAAGTSFDIATDDPEYYNNKGRYPLVLAQSCFVGDIHTTSRLLNERFVLTPEKGSIGFIAVPEKGIIQPLDDYSTRFHENLFREMYGRSIGEAMQQTVADIILPDFDRKSVCMNMTLHGDPSLILNAYPLPDYSVGAGSLFTDPPVLSTEADSFQMGIVISNLAKNVSDSVHILLSRSFPSGLVKDTIVRIPYITYKDTVSIRLPMIGQVASGLNTMTVTIDAYEEVPEVDDIGNNVTSFTFQVNSTDINPVYPPEFAIVPSDTVFLKATTSAQNGGFKNYRFEIDTTISFNSPLKRNGVVSNTYGVVSWKVPGLIRPDVVYFWRVANDSITDPDTAIASRFKWQQSSFIHKPGIRGWSQAHYHQFKASGLSNVEMVDSLRVFDFVNSNYSLVMTHEESRPSYEINSVNMDYAGCFPIPQLAVAVIDSIDFENPWQADSCLRYYGNFNYYVCFTDDGCAFRTRPDRYFLFDIATNSGTTNFINMIENVVPDGNYLLSWPTTTAAFDTMSQIKSAFSGLGVPQYNGLQTNEKYLLFMKKGDPSSVIFTKGQYPDSLLRIDYLLTRNWDKGWVSSTVVGPALSWESLYWQYASVEAGATPDNIYLQVYGIAPSGQEVLLLNQVFSPGGPTDLSFIQASSYPRLRLRAYVEDLQNRTPPQMSSWQVYYQPVPEGAVNPRYSTFRRDTVQEGEQIRMSIAFENISDSPMDTVLVDYFVFDASNARRDIATRRLNRPLPPGDTVMCEVDFSSLSMRGNNSLWVEVNPRNDQPEQSHFNNFGSFKFTVNPDITNPLIDVTFDGTYILNRDIVSARPHIRIRLRDENRFIALNDTGDFRVSLRSPSGGISFLRFEPFPNAVSNNALLSWKPAELPNNSFRIDYQPELKEDGVYELTVQATDMSGNLSGENDYKVQFEVVNRSTVTEVINYPNPFSTSTRFVFTLTGAVVPDDFRIRIMTVTGKIVREITRAEIGPIRIGRNITEYTWDGKDEFGDPLANGVYLYKVFIGIDGAEVEKRSTSADAYFKKGWGKMYLMR